MRTDFGAWEGKAWTALPRADLDAWAENLASYAPGGGERLLEMLDRVGSALQEACALARENDRDPVWVAHAGVARCVQWRLGDGMRRGLVPCAAHWPVQAPARAAWALYDLTPMLHPDPAARFP